MKRIIILGLILALILGLVGCWVIPEPPVPPPEPPINYPVYRGFFVGVGKYENGWTLPSPATNTALLKQQFEKCKFTEDEIEFIKIDILTNYAATKENILNGIVSNFGEADENDISYFYYMGHGGVYGGTPVITPTDYPLRITVDELETALSSIPGTKVVFLETCHSGNFIDKGEKELFEAFKDNSLDLLNKEGYQVLTSSKGSEVTWDNTLGSYFCRYLIKGCNNLLADINKNGIVDLSELYQYIKSHVSIQTVQIYPYGSTFPIMEY